MMRLFNAWSSLAERYAKPIDEDDIVDIVTGQVVQDRGVISGWDKSKQGHFTNFRTNNKKTSKPIEKVKDGKVEEWQERGKENDGDDEIDSFAVEDTSGDAQHEFDPSIEVAKEFLRPPIDDPLAPAVTDDLEEFMEAEKRRKELYGGDVHSSSDDSELHYTQLRRFRTSRKKGKDRLKVTEEPTGVPTKFSALLSPAPSNCDEDLEIYEAQIRQFRAARLTAEASSSISESDDERCSLPCSSSRKVVPFLSQPASPEKQIRSGRRHQLRTRISCSTERPGVVDSGDAPVSPLERRSTSRSPIPPALHEPSQSPRSNPRKTTTSAQNSSPRHRRSPTFHPRSAPATPSRLLDDVSSDDEIEIIGFNAHRPKLKGKGLKVVLSEDEDFPDSERRSSRPPTIPPSSSPVSSGLDGYRSDSPSFFPPTSSSPVLLPQEDESDDELVGWDLAH